MRLQYVNMKTRKQAVSIDVEKRHGYLADCTFAKCYLHRLLKNIIFTFCEHVYSGAVCYLSIFCFSLGAVSTKRKRLFISWKLTRTPIISTGEFCVIAFYIISSIMHTFWLVLTYDPLEDRRIDHVIILFRYYIKEVTHSAITSCATFLSLPHFDVICGLLLNRCTATWKLFVK